MTKMFSNWTYAFFGLVLGCAGQLVMNWHSVPSVVILTLVVTVIMSAIFKDWNNWLNIESHMELES